MHDIETAVIGAGVVGLAIARTLALTGRSVVAVERHDLVGSETSARNSEVIHAGIYYPKGSLKALMCVEGRKRLYAYCRDHGVDHARVGKLIVATSEDQRGRLAGIAGAAAANGVDDMVVLDGPQARAMEPKLSCVAALHSPSTGIVDSHGLMMAYEGELDARGGQVALNTDVAALRALDGGGYGLVLRDGETVTAREVVVSAGLKASALMATLGGPYAPPATGYAKGNYYALSVRAPFSRLIYPVPEPGGLGVHLTIDLAGRGRFGPDVEWLDETDPDRIDYTVDPARAEGFYDAIRRYWPDLPDDALRPDYSGVRPKLSGRGEPAADFVVHGPEAHGLPGLVALYGIESPGLTASLALAEHVAGLLSRP
ncbi:MAG: NAD(P)/FAD-dependent oxidoreductase [Rhodobiaceae bacterium]|nr:NAD(P)/FAD-dependent oxidoreductase [Rhodobiaceae bacterium]